LNKKDIFIAVLVLFSLLWLLLVLNTKYTALTYKYNRGVDNFTKLTKNNKKLHIAYSSLSSPERIMDFAKKNLGLELPKANQVYFIEKH